MKKPTAPGSLVSRAELQEILGVSRQRVKAMDDQLPAPLDVVENGRRPIWRRSAIEKWKAQRDEARIDRVRDARADLDG